jgi:peptidoglycan/LPS O-acetylase OafA/YrhL
MAARVAAIALLTAIWAHALLDFGGAGTADFFARWVHDAVFVVAALGCLAHAAAERRGRLPAAALGVGLLLVAVGDLIYSMAPDLTRFRFRRYRTRSSCGAARARNSTRRRSPLSSAS